MGKMKIEIWSDIACPFCYIGKRKLDKALSQFSNKDKVELVWHSYELNPSLPKEGIGKSFYEYFSENHGVSIDEAKQSLQNTKRLADEVGLQYNYDNLVVTNTKDALRLVKLAKKQGLATEMEEVLFDAYFVKGLNIGDRATLITLGVKVGLNENEITQMLDSSLFANEVDKDVEYCDNELNLEYIPFYIFNSNRIVQGSISSEDYLDILNKSFSEWEKGEINSDKKDVVSGQSCSIDGHCS